MKIKNKLFNKKSIKLLRLSFLIIAGIVCQSASALNIDNLFIIGDSLSDQGNCFNPGFPQPPVTNGNTYTFYLANKLGQQDFPFLQGGNNFACVGASTGFESAIPPPLINIVNGETQVQQLLQNNPKFGSNSLFIYWLGANDILLSEPISTFPANIYPVFNANASVNNTINSLNKLHSAGARYLVVLNLPALERTPEGILNPALTAAYTNEPREFNQLLLNRLRNVGYEVIQIDLFSVFNYLLDNAVKFGFTDITHGCTTNPVPGQTCATSFFFNAVHPSDKTHRMLADFLYSVLSAPDFVASLADTQIAQLQGQNALIRQQLYPQQIAQEVGKIYPFVSGSFNPGTQPALNPDRIKFSSMGGNGTVGVLTKLNDNFLIGGAMGQMYNAINYDINNSGFNNLATAFSLFASYQQSRFYINAILNYAFLNFNNIERNFFIGPILETANGKTSGDQGGASVQLGYNLIDTDTITSGPIIGFDYQSISVNGYTESGNDDVFNLAYDDQSKQSMIGSIGWQTTFKQHYNNMPVNTNVFITMNKEFENGDRDIFFHQVTLPIDFASLPVTQVAGVYASAGINVAARFENGWLGSIGYIGSYGDANSYSNLILLGLSIPL